MSDMYIDKTELEMYRINPAPPKWDLQEYILAYKSENDEKYLNWFLHYYENTLNNNVLQYMRRLFMPEHFADMKQAYVVGLLKALENYDISQGVLFTIFKEHYAEKEVLDYVRSMRTGFTAQSLAEYATLRKAMAIWDKFNRTYDDETISNIASELDESDEDTKKILLGGILNENQVDMYRQYADEDSENTAEEITIDNNSDPYYLLMKKELWSAYESLSFTERKMLAQRYGFCEECHSVFYMDTEDLDEYGCPKKKPIKPMLYTDIATDHEYSSANTAKSKCEKAIDKLRKAVKDFI